LIRIGEDPLDLNELLEAIESPLSGAITLFDGRVRNHSNGRQVLYLEYEAYEALAKSEMEAIRQEALDKWPVEKVAMFHRVGKVGIGESSVLIAVSSAHRGQAFLACQFIIDELKKRVPIWKKEFFADGEIWVDN